jgi:Flp pilus assembly pilin Flp
MTGGRRWLQRGQGMVEYGFILTLVAVVVLTMLVTTGHAVISLFSNITATMHAAGL